MAKPDGGPAFPLQERLQTGDGEQWLSPGQSGMSLRDYFAGQALTGYLQIALDLGSVNAEDVAVDAYKYADAMLKAREAE